MKINKLSDETCEIWERPISGFDWKLIRKNGVGTYAEIAGLTDYDAAYREIKDVIGE